MSRAYRIAVEESLTRIIKAHDGVKSKVDMLPVLGKEDMNNILAQELEKDGFDREGDVCKKEEDGIVVTVDLGAREVEIKASKECEVEVKKTANAMVDRDHADIKKEEEKIKNKLCQELEKDVDKAQEQLQKEITDRLEKQVHQQLDKINAAATRATGSALKVKAAQMGEIKEISEGSNGQISIKVKV
jgi:plasmid maintenance system killer protein